MTMIRKHLDPDHSKNIERVCCSNTQLYHNANTREYKNPTMSSLPPALNFAETEEEICKQWKEQDSFRQQDKLAEERGDEVSCDC